MRLDLRPRIALVLVLALGVIGAALAAQHIGGLVPCALCLKQRVPYYLAIPLLALAYWHAPHGAHAARGLLTTIGAVFVLSAALGAYHAGIEYGIWAGPATCTSGGIGGGGGGARIDSAQALFDALESGTVMRCDAPAWTVFGISLAGYNALASLALAALALGQKTARE